MIQCGAIKKETLENDYVKKNTKTCGIGLKSKEIDSLAKKIRIPRSKKYVNAIAALAPIAEGDTCDCQDIADENLCEELVGILGPCAIKGCIIHTMDREGRIYNHYQKESDLPDLLYEGYKKFCEYRGCIAVEVYSHYFCIINSDGSVKVIGR